MVNQSFFIMCFSSIFLLVLPFLNCIFSFASVTRISFFHFLHIFLLCVLAPPPFPTSDYGTGKSNLYSRTWKDQGIKEKKTEENLVEDLSLWIGNRRSRGINVGSRRNLLETSESWTLSSLLPGVTPHTTGNSARVHFS